jgi:hypothetical protein
MRTKMRGFAVLVALLTVLIPRPASLLETEVQHGESPKWSGPTSGRYAVTVVGYYTDRPDLARAGVRKVEWQAADKAKRRAEMLALRTAFLDWFVEEWVREGGERADGVHQILGYPLR